MTDPKPTLADLLADAQLMLNTLRNVDSHIFRKVAASSLVTIAAKIQDELKAQEENQ